MRASGRSTLLTTRITGSCASSALRSTKRVWGSGPSLASTSSSTPSTIVSPRSTSPPKSAWPGVSMMLSLTPAVADRGVLGQDRDALLALEVHRVHHALGDVLVGAEGARLPQHGVDQRRLAVVDVGHDGDVADVLAELAHPAEASPLAVRRASASVGNADPRDVDAPRAPGGLGLARVGLGQRGLGRGQAHTAPVDAGGAVGSTGSAARTARRTGRAAPSRCRPAATCGTGSGRSTSPWTSAGRRAGPARGRRRCRAGRCPGRCPRRRGRRRRRSAGHRPRDGR